jgi:hypothetical protein
VQLGTTHTQQQNGSCCQRAASTRNTSVYHTKRSKLYFCGSAAVVLGVSTCPGARAGDGRGAGHRRAARDQLGVPARGAQHVGLPALPYVTAGSKTRHPEKPCCPGLLKSHPVCLCQLLAGGARAPGRLQTHRAARQRMRRYAPTVKSYVSTSLGPCMFRCNHHGLFEYVELFSMASFGVPVPMGLVPSAAPVSGIPASSSIGPEVPGNLLSFAFSVLRSFTEKVQHTN